MSTATGKPKKFKAAAAIPDGGPIKNIATGRAEVFKLDPRHIRREPEFNQRLDFGDIPALAESILAIGIQTPLKIRKEGSAIYLVDGDRRMTAVELLITEGRWPEDPEHPGFPLSVPCTSEAKFTKPVERFFMQLALNSGKNFSLLEKGRAYLRIQAEDAAMTGAEIARRTGETKQAVSNALCLASQASPTLLKAIREGFMADSTALEIIKKAGEDHEQQDALFSMAVDAATVAGRQKVMPKDIPEPMDLVGFKLSSQTRSGSPLYFGRPRAFGLGDFDFCADRAIHADLGLPDYFAIGWLEETNGTWTVGYWFQKGQDIKVRTTKRLLPESKSFNDLRAGITESAETGMEFLGWPAAMADSILKRILATVPAQVFRNKHAPAPGPEADPETNPESDQDPGSEDSDTSPDSSPDHCSLITDHSKPRFVLYQITGGPPDLNADGRYHETDRLVLEDRPAGVPLLHLLCHFRQDNVCYGYRCGDFESLPDPADMFTRDMEPADAFSDQLTIALQDHPRKDELLPLLMKSLGKAMSVYYPDSGDGEDPVLLPYVAPADPGAIERIKSAPSSNRDGSGVSLGNDSKFHGCEDQLKKLDGILEDLGDKGHPARLETANLVYNFLMAEASPATVRNHLLGKA